MQNLDDIKLIFVLQNNSSHFTLNRVKCEKQILPSAGFEVRTHDSCIRDKRHTERHTEYQYDVKFI